MATNVCGRTGHEKKDMTRLSENSNLTLVKNRRNASKSLTSGIPQTFCTRQATIRIFGVRCIDITATIAQQSS